MIRLLLHLGLASAALLGGLPGTPPVAQDEDPDEAATTESEGAETGTEAPPAEPSPPGAPSLDHRLAVEEIEASLAALVEAHPGLARAETVGVSRGGHSLGALVLTDPAIAAAGAKPALLVTDHLDPSRSRGTEIALALAWDLAERFEQDPEVARLLRDVAIYVVPCLDPDRRAPVGEDEPPPPDRGVHFDCNFPAGWQPEVVAPGSGPYPLSEPETLATARFLVSHPDVVAIVAPQDEGCFPESSDSPLWSAAWTIAPEDIAFLLEDTSSAYPLYVPFPAGYMVRGSLLAHAYEICGIHPFILRQPSPDAPWESLREPVRGIEDLARRLSRVTLGERSLERLGAGLWQLDVLLRNEGELPTRSHLARLRLPGPEIRITVGGAKLVALAGRTNEEEPYRVLVASVPEGQDTIAAGNLDAGEGRWLRLILQAEAGATVTLAGSSACAGTARLERVLP